MSALRWLARPAMAGMYVFGGIDAIRHPKEKADAAGPVAVPLVRKLPGNLPEDPVRLVRINGVVQVVAGSMLAFGRWPRLASAALLASTVPTTLAAHRFWEETEPSARAGQRVHFLKNLSMAGGLLLAVADTGGRPSWSWWSRRAAQRAALAASGAAGAATGVFGAVEAVAGDAIDAVGDALTKATVAAEQTVRR
ncbi:MAG: DoxX family protein [Acidimicrobiia bacterium]